MIEKAASDSILEMFGVFSLRMEENAKRSSVTAYIMTLSDLFSIFFSYIFYIPYLLSLSLSICLHSTHMVTEYMGIRNESFMKMAAVGTWMGDFVTAWMVSWFFNCTIFFFFAVTCSSVVINITIIDKSHKALQLLQKLILQSFQCSSSGKTGCLLLMRFLLKNKTKHITYVAYNLMVENLIMHSESN